MKTIPMLRALALVLTLTATALHAQVPQILNYQGRVAVGDPAVNFDGSGAFKFALVQGAGPTLLWKNDGSAGNTEPAAAVTLPVTKGLYSVLLGANMTAIPATVFANPDVRLRVWFNDGTNGSQLLTPDQRIVAVGYAMVADTVSDGAITSAKLAAGAVGNAQLAAGALPASLEIAGNFQIAEANTSYRATSAVSTSFSLPTSANVGDVVQINSSGTGGWSAPSGLWTPRENSRSWQSVASSADGTKLVAAEYGGRIYTSTDSGVSWTVRENTRNWFSVASSADGSKLVAAARNSNIFTSTDSGVNWTPRESSRSSWQSVASSADGIKLVAAEYGGRIYTSIDSGVSWTARENTRNWSSVASAAAGTKLVAVDASPGQIYTSTDSGVSWTPRDSTRYWGGVASSADGSKLVACVGGVSVGKVYTSTDSGVTWAQLLVPPTRQWFSVASSADGSKIVAVAVNGSTPIYVSTDSGASWTTQDSGRSWSCVTSSADGTRLLAGAYSDQLFTSDAISGGQGVTSLQYLGNGQWGTVAQTQVAPGAVGTVQLASGLMLGGTTTGTFSGNVAGNLTGNATTAGSATNFTGSLAGDVTGAQNATVVATVGGLTAADVASGANLANAATTANTAATIVKRDGSGNFAAGTITGTFSGDGSGLTNIPASATAAPIHAATPQANMVWIKEGSFAMGSPLFEVGRSTNEGPHTSVTISRGFWMGIYEVTQAQYQAVMGNNPSFFTGNMNRPVENLNRHSSMAYCAALTTSERAAGRCPADWSYRLPTEAEWEYACRAGTATRFSYGDDPGYTLLTNYAWYSSNSDSTTHPVGQKAPNPWGLYDMHGNVFEWCQDSWAGGPNYSGGSTIDPLFTWGSNRVLRGGDWSFDGSYARCAYRYGYYPDDAYDGYGFRAVLAPGQ